MRVLFGVFSAGERSDGDIIFVGGDLGWRRFGRSQTAVAEKGIERKRLRPTTTGRDREGPLLPGGGEGVGRAVAREPDSCRPLSPTTSGMGRPA